MKALSMGDEKQQDRCKCESVAPNVEAQAVQKDRRLLEFHGEGIVCLCCCHIGLSDRSQLLPLISCTAQAEVNIPWPILFMN